MQAVILAAGQGVRIGRITRTIPKPLLKVGKKPILEHTFSQLPDEIHEVIIVVGHLQEQIRKYFGRSFLGRQIRYIEQSEKLGTGHALFICKDFLENKKFLVAMGDDLYLKKDMEKCLKYDLALLAQKIDTPERFGVLKIENDILKEIIESPKLGADNLVNCGLYVLDKRIFDYSLASIGNGEYGLPQTMVKMAKDHPIKIERANFWLSINTVQDLKRADKYLKKLYQ
jgi:UDP-N-acetylglucosamine diphosphorylase / glucose-1-phosphate thymidylyltransferase / UDP-N-acetylgalactosamine diphosphorylase / glucosamine-1-phosphate N-acetyltransferase / galactosamine-1-phosphate N-acetyltransferase